MAKTGQSRTSSGGRIKVDELSATCSNVALAPTGGWRATLAVTIQLVGPDGQRYRGAGSRLHVRVYPVKPVKGEAPRGTSKRKAAAKK